MGKLKGGNQIASLFSCFGVRSFKEFGYFYTKA